jgi:hypothetical protein
MRTGDRNRNRRRWGVKGQKGQGTDNMKIDGGVE